MKTHLASRAAIPTVALSAWLLVPETAHCFYNPSTGKWISRDPIGEAGFQLVQRGTKAAPLASAVVSEPVGRSLKRDLVAESEENPYHFARNSAVNLVDILGLITRGGSMQMNCRQPCEDYKRLRYGDMEPGDVPNGAIVCCGGVKFICTWGADKENNQRAREIAKRCLRAHERVHLPSVTCDECATGPVAVKWKKSGKEACEEEVMVHGVSKSCFESALSECGGDQRCLDAFRAWIQQEGAAIELYKGICKQFGR